MNRSPHRPLSRTHAMRLWLASLLSVFGVLTGSSCMSDFDTAAEETAAAVRVEPAQLLFHPQTDTIQVKVVNPGQRLSNPSAFHVEGPDWDAFTIVGSIDPTPLQPGESKIVSVRVDPDRFRGANSVVDSIVADPEREASEARRPTGTTTTVVDPQAYRDGMAQLVFASDGREIRVPITFENPSWVSMHLVPALVKILLIVFAFVMPLASLLTWMERKQSAMMQDRVGPNMARISIGGITLRLWGLLHIATDGIKMLFKEDFVPRRAHKQLYALAPLLSFIPALVVFAIVPFGDALCYEQMFDVVSQADVNQCSAGRGGTPLQIAQLDVGLLFYFAIATLATYGTTLAGWASYNKWAILGSLRASAQMISYEVAIGLTIVGALLVYGTLEPHALVRAQLDTFWGIFLQPVAFVLFLTAAIAETKRAPFDLPEGESEIIGYFIEYSGMRFGLFFLAEFIEIVFVSALVTTLFLGGWSLPFGMFGAAGFSSQWAAAGFFTIAGLVLGLTGAAIWRASKHGEFVGSMLALVGFLHLMVAMWALMAGWGTQLPHVMVVLLGMATWGVKVLALCWLQLLIRWTLPRFRYDQLMSLGWKGLLPLSIANIVLTAIVVYFLAPTEGPSSWDSGQPQNQATAQAEVDRQ